jgi:signal transduction histidine kinase
MLDFVFNNLIYNAIKFSNKNGIISISANEDGDKIKITIKDHGIGMSEKLIKSILKDAIPYSSLGTNNETGLGQGLILSKNFITLHKGKLKIKSEEGVGTLVTVSLPLYPESKKSKKEKS